MKNILRQKDIFKLSKDPVICAIYSCVKDLGADIYLVGGAVRNLISRFKLGFDYDFAMSSKIKETAERLAMILDGSPFLLDKDTGSFRIVIHPVRNLSNKVNKYAKESCAFNKEISNVVKITIDLSPLKGRDIFGDLLMRDFTINAMAVDVRKLFEKGEAQIIDPLDGIHDSKKRIISMIKDTVFEDDPVRLLRAVRLSAQYGFSISRETEELLKAKSHLLKTSSWERLRDEFFIILDCHNSRLNLKRLYAMGLLQEIFPEIGDSEILKNYDLMSHIIKAVGEGERLLYDIKEFMPEYADAIQRHFDSAIENMQRASLFKLAVFLHDIGKPVTMKTDGKGLRFTGHDLEGAVIAKRIAKRIKLGRKSSLALCKLVRNHHRIFGMASQQKLTYRSKAHLFRIMDKDGIDLLFLSLADARATRDGEDLRLVRTVKELISFYYEVYSVKKHLPILKGDEVMRLFNVPEGVMVGRILKKIQDAEGAGIINNKKEAQEFIRKWLAKGAFV